MSATSRRPVRTRLGPLSPAALGAGAVIVVAALFTAWTGTQITAVVLDETVYKFAAAQYTDGLISGVLNDTTSRGIARLYALVLAPILIVFEGDVGVRAARALNAVLFTATAVPVFFLALRAGATRAGAWVAAAGAVAVPWLTLATILFSESLAYLLFACTLLAMLRLLDAPSLRREALVLGLLGALVVTRVQFLVVVVAWVAFLALVSWRAPVRPWRAYPLTCGLTVLVALILLVRPRTVTGPYYELSNRDAVPGNFGTAALWEVEMLALGIGLIPALLGSSWAARAWHGALGGDQRRLARLSVVLVGAIFAGTLFAQGGFLDFRSEERYFIYAIPLLWVGAAAALTADVPARWLAWSGVGLAVVLFLLPNPVGANGEQLFLGPVSGVLADAMPPIEQRLGDVLGLTGVLSSRDILGLGALMLTALTVTLWRRGARWAVLVPAAVLQLTFGVYAFTGTHGGLARIGGITGGPSFTDLGWIDRGTEGGPDVRLLDNQVQDREALQRSSFMWNDEVLSVYGMPELERPAPAFPMFTLPTQAGRLTGPLTLDAPPRGDVLVSAVDSPAWQLDSRDVLRAPDGRLALVEPTTRLRWMARGLGFDGQLVDQGTELSALGGRRVTMALRAPIEGQPARAIIQLGDRAVRFDAQRTPQMTARFDLCAERGVVRGTMRQVNAVDIGADRFSAALVTSVRVEPC